MPTSHYLQLNTIVEAIVTASPQALLDIGVGFGKYGVLAREYLDISDGRGSYRDWKRRIDGVEAFREYITPLHEFVYDEVFIGNATDVVPKLTRQYDLVLLIDVIEHLTKEEGLKLMRDCLAISRNVLVSTPNEFIEQHEMFDNVHEIHKSHWTAADFAALAPMCVLPNAEDTSLVCFVGRDTDKMRRGILGWRRRFKTIFPPLIKPYRALKAIFHRRRGQH